MTDPTLVFANDAADGLEVVVNFGLFAGREATPAEIDRLAEALLPDLEPLEILCEQRYKFDREREANVYQVKIPLADEDAELRELLLETVEEWARDCIADRRLLNP
jgi:hypothetical protein